MDIKEDPDWEEKIGNEDPKFSGGLRKGSETWSLNGSAQGKMIKELKNKKNFQGHIYITNWPSMFLAIFVDHVRVVRVLPIDHENTQVSAEWLFEKSTYDDKKYDKKNVIDFAIKVMLQDGEACELNQKGIYNPGISAGVLMPEEYEVKRFQDWIRHKLQ
jgi:Rieske 2Fe-2S family protein